MSKLQDIVSRSSLMAAAVRAIETKRNDGLFKDPLAEKLAGEDVITEVAPHAQDYEDRGTPLIIVRTRFFDDFLMNEVYSIPQIVILGAGMDTRAFRLSWQKDTHIFELDRPEVLEYKTSILQNIESKCYRHLIPTDIRESWAEKLIESGFQVNIPSVWIMEGFLYYLDENEVHQLLKTITELSTPHSWIAGDLINSYFVSKKSEDLSLHWKYGCDDPEQLFTPHNWKALVVQAGDEGANYGRFTHKFEPKEVLNVPHYFFVKAFLKDKNNQ